MTALKLRWTEAWLVAVSRHVQEGHTVIIVLALPGVAVLRVPMVADVIVVAVAVKGAAPVL